MQRLKEIKKNEIKKRRESLQLGSYCCTKTPGGKTVILVRSIIGFQVDIPFVRVPLYQICANLLPLFKHNLELINCLTLSTGTCIFMTCIYLTYFTSFL